MNPDRIDSLLTGIPEGELRSIVPAFFVIDAPADAADEAASACAEDLNQSIREVAHPNAARVRLFLCEGSKTSELPVGADVPHTLEGFTCDALPRVDTTAALDLIREISLTEAGGNSDPDVMARALDNIVGKAQGFIRDANTAIEVAAAAEGFGLVLEPESASEAALVARYRAFASGVGRELGSASDEIHRDDWSAAQRAWLTDFILEWDACMADQDLARGQYDVHVTDAEPVAAVPGTITLSFTVDDQFCADVMCAALEGGIGYWAAADDIVKKPGSVCSDYVSCTLLPEEEDDFVPATLDYDSIRIGIARVLSEGFQVSGLIRDAIARGVANSDAGEIDADAADCIVQAAFFGSITYG